MGLFNKEPEVDYSSLMCQKDMKHKKELIEKENQIDKLIELNLELKETINQQQESINLLTNQTKELEDKIEIARGLKKKQNKRTFIQVRLSYAEKNNLIKLAEKHGLNLSQLIKESIVHYDIKTTKLNNISV